MIIIICLQFGKNMEPDQALRIFNSCEQVVNFWIHQNKTLIALNDESWIRVQRYIKMLRLLFLFANCFFICLPTNKFPWHWNLFIFFTMSSHERFEQLNFKFFRVNPFKAQNQICWEQKELEKYLSQRERIGEASRIHLKTNPPHHHRLFSKALFIIQTSQAEKGKVSLDEFRRLVASRSFL